MFKKNSVQNVSCLILSKKDLQVLEFLQNWIGGQKFIKNIFAAIVITSGTMPIIILSVCLI